MHYFIRVNGDTTHNDPEKPDCYVPHEPPVRPKTYFNYLKYCLRNDIVRIGWPDVGDLSKGNKAGALANCYDRESVPVHVRGYLSTFRDIQLGSLALVPDQDSHGDIYIGEVTAPYHYFHDVPLAPYECAHRLGVTWDKNKSGQPIFYRASVLGIPTRGGFWATAFQHIERSAHGQSIVERVAQERAKLRS